MAPAPRRTGLASDAHSGRGLAPSDDYRVRCALAGRHAAPYLPFAWRVPLRTEM